MSNVLAIACCVCLSMGIATQQPQQQPTDAMTAQKTSELDQLFQRFPADDDFDSLLDELDGWQQQAEQSAAGTEDLVPENTQQRTQYDQELSHGGQRNWTEAERSRTMVSKLSRQIASLKQHEALQQKAATEEHEELIIAKRTARILKQADAVGTEELALALFLLLLSAITTVVLARVVFKKSRAPVSPPVAAPIASAKEPLLGGLGPRNSNDTWVEVETVSNGGAEDVMVPREDIDRSSEYVKKDGILSAGWVAVDEIERSSTIATSAPQDNSDQNFNNML